MGHFPNDKNLSQTLIPSQELSIVLSRLDPVQQPCAYKCGLWSSDCLGSKSWLCHLQAEIMLVKHSSSVWHIRGVCQMSDISIITAFQLGFLVHISLYFLTIAQILGFFKLMLFPFLECRFFFDWKFHFFFFLTSSSNLPSWWHLHPPGFSKFLFSPLCFYRPWAFNPLSPYYLPLLSPKVSSTMPGILLSHQKLFAKWIYKMLSRHLCSFLPPLSPSCPPIDSSLSFSPPAYPQPLQANL